MHYYNVFDIQELTGCSKNKCYAIIRNLNSKFKELYPNREFIQGKIPKWFFEEAMGIKKGLNESNQNNLDQEEKR